MIVRLQPALAAIVLVLGLIGCGGSGEAEVERDPAKAQELFETAQAFLAEGKTVFASKELEKAVRADPELAEAWYQLGLCYQPLARGERALECFENAAKADAEHARARVEAGRMRCRLREFDKGLPLLEQAVALAPEDHVAEYALGAALLAAGKPAEARPHLERAVDLYPGFSGAWFHLGKTLIELDEPAKAREVFETCLSYRPTHLGALHQIARLEERAGDTEDAERHRTLHRLLTEIDQLGRRSVLGAEDELRVAIANALRFDPQNWELHLRLGDWHHEHGDPQNALQRFEAARQLAPERPQPYRRLAEIYQELGKGGQARAAAARYQQLYQEDPQD